MPSCYLSTLQPQGLFNSTYLLRTYFFFCTHLADSVRFSASSSKPSTNLYCLGVANTPSYDLNTIVLLALRPFDSSQHPLPPPTPLRTHSRCLRFVGAQRPSSASWCFCRSSPPIRTTSLALGVAPLFASRPSRTGRRCRWACTSCPASLGLEHLLTRRATSQWRWCLRKDIAVERLY